MRASYCVSALRRSAARADENGRLGKIFDFGRQYLRKTERRVVGHHDRDQRPGQVGVRICEFHAFGPVDFRRQVMRDQLPLRGAPGSQIFVDIVDDKGAGISFVGIGSAGPVAVVAGKDDVRRSDFLQIRGQRGAVALDLGIEGCKRRLIDIVVFAAEFSRDRFPKADIAVAVAAGAVVAQRADQHKGFFGEIGRSCGAVKNLSQHSKRSSLYCGCQAVRGYV